MGNRAERRAEKKAKRFEGKEKSLKRSFSYFDCRFSDSSKKCQKNDTIWLRKKLGR